MPKVWTVTLVVAAATASWGACAGETKGSEHFSSLLAAQTRSDVGPLLEGASLPAAKSAEFAAMGVASKPDLGALSASSGDRQVGTSSAAADTAPTSVEAQRVAGPMLASAGPAKPVVSSLTLDLGVEKASDRFGAVFAGSSPELGR
jgi:uncharacterized protein (DUF1800 family)